MSASVPELPVAVDVMGGDNAPDEILAGARRAVAELGIPVVLVGLPEVVDAIDDLPTLACSEVIAMAEDPATGVRRKKDSSLVRAAELVRDGKACAMVSAGNTGATMASALLRMGRIRGVARPAIATPIPVPGRDTPTVLLDAGANAECSPDWLVQFAQMGAVYATDRYHIAAPRVGLLSIGEEPTKGTPLVKDTHRLLAAGDWIGATGATFVGNVEGRDLLGGEVDVIVTDGFTGNVALKTLEGAMRSLVGALFTAFGSTPETRAATDVLLPALLPLYATLDPENTGGAVLLGVDGICVISHGSSKATAVLNAVRVAAEAATGGLVDHLATTIRPA